MRKLIVLFLAFAGLAAAQCRPAFDPLLGIVTCPPVAASSVGPAGPAGPVGPAGPSGQDGAPGVPGYSPNSLLSGGQVVWTSGLAFTVSATAYQINGTNYTAPQATLTLEAADATNPRFDAIVVNSSSAAAIIKGTAASNPARPNVDPSTQLLLSFIYIPANATTPENVTSTLIYDENAGGPGEWTATKTGTPINLASTVNPYTGTKDIEGTAVVAGNFFNFAPASPVNPAGANYLVFYVRSKAAWSKNRSLQIQFWLSGAAEGSIVTLNEGAFGFASATTATYQQIVVPVSLFGSVASLDGIRFTAAGTGGTMGFYVDAVSLQAGLPAPSASVGLAWKGAWNATAAYGVNDLVRGADGMTYVALAANTNSAPTAANANWAMTSKPMRAFTFTFDGGGSALTAGKTLYLRAPFACALANWSILSDTAETVTVKLWRVAAGGTAVPAVGNSISTSGVSLSTGTAVYSTTLTDFTSTAIALNDLLAANLVAVTAATNVNYTVGCQQ